MPYSHYDLKLLKDLLEKAHLSGYIYQHNQHLLALQEAFNEDGSAYNNFIQHELSADQLGLQYGLRLSNDTIEFLVGITHSNQDRSYEIGAGNLKGDQKAFNLNYAFYNYPKGFYLISMPLAATSAQSKQAIEQQFLNVPEMAFLESAVKTNPRGEQVQWMKRFVIQESLNMKVRIQTALL
jgi:hypothetical protein